MRASVHPITMIREKENENGLLTKKHNITLLISTYLETLDCFHQYCTVTIQIMNDKIYSRSSTVKKVRTAIKKCDENFSYSKAITEDLFPIKEQMEQLGEFTAKLQREKETLKSMIMEEYDLNRDNLKTFFLSSQNVTQSLYQVNRNLIPRLQKYLSGGEIKAKEQRKLELVLMRIATRGVTKTSPLSKFNSVSFVKSNVGYEDKPLSYRTDRKQITINNVFLHRIYEFFSLATIKDTPFIINDNYYFENGEILVFTQQSNHNKVYNTNDKITKLKANKIIVDILSEYNKQVVSYDKLINRYQLPESKIKSLLINLFNTGILKFKNYLSDNGSPLRRLINHIEGYQGEKETSWIAISALLREIESELDDINVDGMRNRIDHIYRLSFKISQLIGMEPFKEQLIYEDNVIQPYNKKSVISKKDLKGIENILKLFTIFDVNTKIQLELSDLLLEKYGSTKVKVSDPTLFQHVGNINMKYSGYWTAPWEEIKSDNDKIKKLNELRNSFITLLTKQQSKSEIVIHYEEIEKLYKEIPESIQQKEASYSFFYQKEQDSIIINKIYPGFMSFYHRFIRYTDLINRYKEEMKQFYNEHGLIEINESFGFNANVYDSFINYRLKFALTRDHEIDYLYKGVYELNDMVLVWANPDFYLEDGEGKRFKPIISSSLIRVLYPGLIAFYSALFSNISHVSEISSVFLQDIGEYDVIAIPAIKIENITLERRKWLVKTDIFPEHSHDDLLNSMINLVDIVTKYNLPEKFYVQKRKLPYEEECIKSISVEFDKPQFIDLNNIILVKVLFNFVKTSKWLLISEVLPIKTDAPEYLTEFNLSKSEKEVFQS